MSAGSPRSVRESSERSPNAPNAPALTPTILQDAATGDVISFAWSSPDSLERTRRTGEAWVWSRATGDVWLDTDAAGTPRRVVAIEGEDRSALIFRVDASQVASEWGGGALSRLDAAIAARVLEPTSGYTSRLLCDRNARIKKLGEEAAEFLVAASSGTDEELIGEGADLLYIMAVVLRARGVPLSEVLREIRSRES